MTISYYIVADHVTVAFLVAWFRCALGCARVVVIMLRLHSHTSNVDWSQTSAAKDDTLQYVQHLCRISAAVGIYIYIYIVSTWSRLQA